MTVKKFGPKQYKTCHLFAVGPSSPMYIRKLLEFAFRFQSLQQDSCAWLMLEPMSPWGCYQKNIHFWDPSEKFVWVHLGQRKNIVLTKTFQQIYVNWNFMIVYAQRSEIIVVSLFWFFISTHSQKPQCRLSDPMRWFLQILITSSPVRKKDVIPVVDCIDRIQGPHYHYTFHLGNMCRSSTPNICWHHAYILKTSRAISSKWNNLLSAIQVYNGEC